MAETLISNIQIPDNWQDMVVNKTVEKSALWQSGLVATDPRVSIGSDRKGGETVIMPFWNDLDGNEEELSDKKDLTVDNIDTGNDVAVLQAIGKAFGSNDLAMALNVNREDPVDAIAGLIGEWYARIMQKRSLSLLTGVFSATNVANTDNVFDISGLAAGAAVIDGVNFVDARWRLGDMSDQLTAVAMHSAVKAKLEKDDLIDTIKASSGLTFETYQGKRVIIDDTCPVTNGVYTTYLFGPGAIGHAEGMPKVPFETDRNSLGSMDILISRRHFVLHVRGVKWTGSALISTGDATSGHPTRTDLATGSNWTRVYDPKNIRVVAFKHRIAAAG